MQRVRVGKDLKEKVAKAKEMWRAQKVQVLVNDDEVPEGHEIVLQLGELTAFLEGIEVPTKVVVDGQYYKVKLRKRVPYESYQEILSGLNGLSSARWDRNERAILVKRSEEREFDDIEESEVEYIVIAPEGGVKA